MDFKCVVVTPEKTVLDKTVSFVALPLYDGELGVASGHAPLIGRLGTGELRLKTGVTTEVYVISGGFVEILNNTVCLMTDRATPISAITVESAQKAMLEAQNRPSATAEQRELKTSAMERSRVFLKIAHKYAK